MARLRLQPCLRLRAAMTLLSVSVWCPPLANQALEFARSADRDRPMRQAMRTTASTLRRSRGWEGPPTGGTLQR
ncbi:hypothetical protein C8F04DRAFT_1141729 [Mycena alexandri]|uniref:Uncharacterized protein n=1 Tax=Mycena alexandri TaxID=1745969 RepID=A0AAD6S6L8_9AGAR|nr:hypothetical protein C8F04DRAFT_1141729 [Mycena alexandri]